MTTADGATAPPAPEVDEDEVPSIFEYYTTDVESEENGKWFEELQPGFSIKLRRVTSKAYLQARRRILKHNRKFARNGLFSPEQQERMLIEAMAEGLIADWRGPAMRDLEGNALPYSKEAAVMLLTKMPALRQEVIVICGTIDNFRVEAREALEGNS